MRLGGVRSLRLGVMGVVGLRLCTGNLQAVAGVATLRLGGVVGWRLGTWGSHSGGYVRRVASNRRPKQKIGGGRLAVRKGQLSKTKRERR